MLQVDLGSGNDNLTITSVHSAETDVFGNGGNDQVTINGVGAAADLDVTANAGTDTITVNSVDGTVTINGSADADRVIVNDIGATGTVTVNGDGAEDHITVLGTTALSTLNINGGGADDWVDVVAMAGTVTIHGNTGNDTVEVGSKANFTDRVVDTGGDVNGISGALTVDGDAPTASDWLYIDETGESTTQTGELTSTTVDLSGLGSPITYLDVEHLIIRLGSGGDVFNVLSSNGPSDTPVSNTDTTIETGLGADTVNVSSNAPTNTGDVNAVVGHLDIDGQGGDDTVNVHDNGDGTVNTGYLTSTDITGLDMGTAVGSAGITYTGLEFVNIDLGSAGDTFTIYSTHAGQTTLDSLGGADEINVQSISGHTLIDGGVATDTITVGSTAPTLGGDVNGIGALLEVTGGTSASDADNLIVDDTGDTSSNVGALTDTTIEGFGMSIGAAHAGSPSDAVHMVTVANAFDGSFTITLGTATTSAIVFDASADDLRDAIVAALNIGGVDAADIQVSRTLHDLELTFLIGFVGDLAGTAGWGVGSVSVDGTNLIGLADYGTATVAAASSSTGRIVYAGIEILDIGLGSAADAFHVRSTHSTVSNVTGGPGNDILLVETISGTTDVDGEDGDDTLVINPLEGIPDAGNGILGFDLSLDGSEGSDLYVVNVWNAETSTLTIHDSGVGVGGIDRLTINGTSTDDTFLLRAGMVASLSAEVAGAFTAAEKIFYDNTIDAGITINTLAGSDTVVFDDNSSLTTVNGGSGNDTFQIGQLLGGEVGFTLDVDTELTEVTWGQLTNGVSYSTTINGGGGNDLFNVYHNLAVVQLNGDSGDDTFVIRTFLGIDENTSIDSGHGRDLIEYIWNAPVSINGGAGFDTVVIIGTEADDEFVITADGVYGAGRYVAFIGVEQLDVDGAEGDDIFNVLSTAPGLVVRIFGGLGSDTVNVGADANAVYGDDLLGHTGLIEHDVESTCDGTAGCIAGAWDGTAVDGLAVEIVDNESNAVIVSETGGSTVVSEAGLIDSYWISLNNAPTHEVRITVAVPGRSPDDELLRSYSLEVSLDGTNWHDGVTLVFDGATFDVGQEVWVRAHGDLSSEGEQSPALQHLVVSDDVSYDALPLNNVTVRTIDDERAGLIVLESTSDTVVTESGTGDTFTVALSRAPLTSTTVTITGDDQVCVQTATDTDDCSVTLTFTPGNWSTVQTVDVSGVSDGAVESFHFGYVTTAVDSADVFTGTVSSVTGKDITVVGDVQFVQNELRGYLFRVTAGSGAGQFWDIWGNSTSTGSGSSWTTVVTVLGVIETALANGDTYYVNGYTPPAVTDVIAGTIADDGDVTDDVIEVSGVTLATADGGLSGATIRVFNADGTTDYRTILSNTATTITVDSDWTLVAGQDFSVLDLQGVAIPLLPVLVADEDSFGVLISPSDAASRVAEGTTDAAVGLEYDTYEVVLTRAPVAGETVTVVVRPVASETLNEADELRNDQQLCVATTAGAIVPVTPSDLSSCGEIGLSFTATNWSTAQTVYVWAIDDDVEDGNLLQDFADSAQRTYLVQGPLIVEGGNRHPGEPRLRRAGPAAGRVGRDPDHTSGSGVRRHRGPPGGHAQRTQRRQRQ